MNTATINDVSPLPSRECLPDRKFSIWHTHLAQWRQRRPLLISEQHSCANERKPFAHKDRQTPIHLDDDETRVTEDGPKKPVTVEGNDSTAPREAVLQACLKNSLNMTALGITLRYLPSLTLGRWPPFDISKAQLLTNDVEIWHIAVAASLVATVTAGRLLLLKTWPEYRTATESSNNVVLPRLQSQDLVLISFLPGFSEELLFRGGLIPALGGSWPAVGLAGLSFGVLHVGGGRNWAFAVWATCVGLAYGAAYLYTQDLFVPVLAHSLANYASALIWLQGRK